jgi:NAD(P)H-dependent FMN reductase
MSRRLKVLIVSSSHDPASRSEFLARHCQSVIADRADVEFIALKDFGLTGHELIAPLKSSAYVTLHSLVKGVDGIILASPVYNWSCCAELKRFIELVGTTPPDSTVESAFFDKVIAFVNAGGGHFSYTAFTGMASSMMLDFKCVISPYNIYADNRDLSEGAMSDRLQARVAKSMLVFLELVTLLQGRTYSSTWEI